MSCSVCSVLATQYIDTRSWAQLPIMRFDIIYDYDNLSLDIFNDITGRCEISELNEFIFMCQRYQSNQLF